MAALIYSNINKERPLSENDLGEIEIPIQQANEYEFDEQIVSSGSFGLVYSGVNRKTGQKVAMKQFVRNSRRWIVNREILCLQELKGGINIIQLEAVIKYLVPDCPLTDYPCLIFEYIRQDFEEVYLNLDNSQTRFFLKELLKALDFCHKKGFMHRDLKPANVVVDIEKKILRLIDFGTAELYFPDYIYKNTGTQVYQPPEALLEQAIDYSVDMWAFGVILAEMLFKRSPFFPTPVLQNISIFFKCISSSSKSNETEEVSTSTSFVPKSDKPSPSALGLMKSLLKYSPSLRLTSEEALTHEFFNEI